MKTQGVSSEGTSSLVSARVWFIYRRSLDVLSHILAHSDSRRLDCRQYSTCLASVGHFYTEMQIRMHSVPLHQ